MELQKLCQSLSKIERKLESDHIVLESERSLKVRMELMNSVKKRSFKNAVTMKKKFAEK